MVINFSAQTQLLILDLQVAQTKGQAMKDSTKKNLLCHFNAYEKFCGIYILECFPCDNKQLCRFRQHLAKTFQSPDAVINYMAGIRTCLALLGLEIPPVQDKQMQLFMQGLKRAMPHATKQAAPITPELLLKISKVVNYRDQVEMVAWVGTLLGFYMFLQKSNLVPDTMDNFNPKQQFRRVDMNLLGLDKVMMFEVRWSKTIQYKQKILRLPVLPTRDKSICPVFWVHQMVARIPGEPGDPVLMVTANGTKMALSANQLIYRIRKWLLLLREEATAYSLHSLRQGSATFAYQSNMEGEMIKLLGDWASDCYKRYIDISMDKRFESMKAFVEALNTICEEI